MCEFAQSEDPVKVRHVVERSAIGVDPQPPGMIARTASLAVAVVAHIATGMHRVDDAVRDARLAICQTNECGHYRTEEGAPACLACGCGRRGLEIKAGWAEQQCPLDPPRWGPVEVT
jgi:hypothetical protein